MFADQFAEELKRRRLALGMSRREIARRCGIREEFIRSVERGHNLATFRKLSRLLSTLASEEKHRARGTMSHKR